MQNHCWVGPATMWIMGWTRFGPTHMAGRGPPHHPPKKRIRVCWATCRRNSTGSGWTRFDPTHI
jgi:hypothetical protein